MKEFFKTLKRYQAITISAVVLTVSVLALGFVVVPLGKKSYGLVTSLNRIQKEVTDLQNKASLLSSLDERVLHEQTLTALSAIPSDASIPSLFSGAEQMAIASGMHITDVTLSSVGAVSPQEPKKWSPEEKQVGSSIVSFIVTGEGSLEQLKNFFEVVAAVRRLVRVKSFSMTFNQVGSATIRVDMETFYAPLPKTIGTVTAQLVPFSDKEEALLGKLGSFALSSGVGGALAPTSGGAGKTNPFSP